MQNKSKSFYLDLLKDVAYLAVAIIFLRISSGFFVFAIILAAICFVFQKQGGKAICCYLSLFFLQNINFAIVPMTVAMNLGCKIGNIVVGFAMLIVGVSKKDKERLPLGGLWLYVVWMALISCQGYFPAISYMKLLNFVFFLCSLSMACRFMQLTPESIYEARVFLLAVSCFLIIGSFATLPFPNIAYSMQVARAERYGIYTTGEELLMSNNLSLFNGLTWHSQALAPMTAVSAIFVLCDMMFVERRFKFFHIIVLIVSVGVMFMTKSRTSLLTIGVSGLVVLFYSMNNVRISTSLKRRIKTMATFAAILGLCAIFIFQFRDQGMSKWLRKTDDVNSDTRSLTEAFTSTRMDSIDMNIQDFKRSPIFGTGFQVLYFFPELYGNVSITSLLSAPCEKGETPLVVLAEGGLVGGVIFYCFVIGFYGYCVRRKYVCLVALFTANMVSNFSESTFFSPSGCGGYMWIMTFAGGLVLDVIIGQMRLADYNELQRVGK